MSKNNVRWLQKYIQSRQYTKKNKKIRILSQHTHNVVDHIDFLLMSVLFFQSKKSWNTWNESNELRKENLWSWKIIAVIYTHTGQSNINLSFVFFIFVTLMLKESPFNTKQQQQHGTFIWNLKKTKTSHTHTHVIQ